MSFWSTLGDIGKGVVGAVVPFAEPVINALSSMQAGKQAAKGAAEQQASSASMAKEQMDFQERMSSSAVQRNVADLRAAGLNPGQAYGGTQESSPSGAMGQAQNVQGAGISTAMAATDQLSRMLQLKANLDVARSQVGVNSATASKLLTDATETAARTTSEYGKGDDGLSYADNFRKFTLEQLRANTGLLGAQTTETSARGALEGLELPMARNRAAAAGSAAGKIMPYFDFLGSAMKSMNFFPH